MPQENPNLLNRGKEKKRENKLNTALEDHSKIGYNC